jgi:hypothetical protein
MEETAPNIQHFMHIPTIHIARRKSFSFLQLNISFKNTIFYLYGLIPGAKYFYGVGKGYKIKYVRGREEKYETRSSVSDPDRIRIQSGQWIQIRIVLRNFMFFSAGCFLLGTEGFSCCLDVLYGGLGISNCNFDHTKFFLGCKCFPIFGHQNP